MKDLLSKAIKRDISTAKEVIHSYPAPFIGIILIAVCTFVGINKVYNVSLVESIYYLFLTIVTTILVFAVCYIISELHIQYREKP